MLNTDSTSRARKTRPRCECGCGQAPAQSTRLRKAACPQCGFTVRLTREWIGRGLPVCPCGTALDTVCLFDRACLPGMADQVFAELAGRSLLHDQRSEYAKRAARRRKRCKSDGCSRWTGKGELFCADHVDQDMPF